MHDVEMDGVLNQPDTQQSAIGKKSYNTTYNAIKLLALILSWMTNLAAWNPGIVPCQANQPKIVFFLEQVICKLVSRAGCNWQPKFKSKKHIGLLILIKVQRILLKLALAVGDPNVGTWNFEEGSMVHDHDLDLQMAFHLM